MTRLKTLAKLGGIASSIAIALIIVILDPLALQAREVISNWLKHDPADTKITLAVDGNKQNVPRNGKTPSTEITFYYHAHKGNTTNINADFECALDTPVFSRCHTNQNMSYYDLAERSHTFEVRVNDPNANREPRPDRFVFTVVPSVMVTGTISQKNFTFEDINATMDNKYSGVIDDIGRLAFPHVAIVKEVPTHEFTFFVSDEQGQQKHCDTHRRIVMPNNNSLGTIYLKSECFKRSISSAVSTTDSMDFFKPEKDLDYARIDLQYNTTLVRKPSHPGSNDGLWSIVLYLEGIDLPSVSKVKYYLHPTFKPNNVITLSPQDDNPKYALHLSAYGGFKLYTKVYLNDGRVLDLSRFLITRY